jgi:2Fe-2S ferredoxin
LLEPSIKAVTKIIFIEHDGTEHHVAAEDGASLMRVGHAHFIPTIRGECGGSGACGSCHVYVDAEWLAKLPPPQKLEQEMIGRLILVKRADSRLSCMISAAPDLDGLVLRLAGPELASRQRKALRPKRWK